MALGERLRGSGARVYCLLSDGELQEGQVWEAAMSASHHRLGNLVALIDNNHMQADGATAQVMGVEPVDRALGAFGFRDQRIDAHDHDALVRRCRSPGPQEDRPPARSYWKRFRARVSPRSSATTRSTTSVSSGAVGSGDRRARLSRQAAAGTARSEVTRGAHEKPGRNSGGKSSKLQVRPRDGRRSGGCTRRGSRLKTPGGTVVLIDPYLRSSVMRSYELPRAVHGARSTRRRRRSTRCWPPTATRITWTPIRSTISCGQRTRFVGPPMAAEKVHCVRRRRGAHDRRSAAATSHRHRRPLGPGGPRPAHVRPGADPGRGRLRAVAAAACGSTTAVTPNTTARSSPTLAGWAPPRSASTARPAT